MHKEEALKNYPNGMNAVIKEFVSKEHQVTLIEQTANDDGTALTDEILENTDVLIWWGHAYHGKVAESVIAKVVEMVNRGMGMVALHSAHESRPFQRLIGTTGALSWREIGENERLWIIEPTHPIFKGIDKTYIDLEHEEMYGEPFSIPAPDELLLISWFRGGEVMRSGCVFNRGFGKVFYFRPGHETLPTYYNEDVQKIILNAIEYVAPKIAIKSDRVKSLHVPVPPEKGLV